MKNYGWIKVGKKLVYDDGLQLVLRPSVVFSSLFYWISKNKLPFLPRFCCI